ncbi:MAG: hypothetical protein IAF38_19615 [Bacteroidia bacterium]|nr:hypothetical protein [Bacteroidia bacterium]
MKANICLLTTSVLLFLCSCNFSYLPEKTHFSLPKITTAPKVVLEKIKIDKAKKYRNKEEITLSKFSKGKLDLEFTTAFSCGQFDTVSTVFTKTTFWLTLKNKFPDSTLTCKDACFYNVKLTASGLAEKPKKILVNYHEIGKQNKPLAKKPGSVVKITNKF